jgi:hypothetical protein
MVHIQAPYTTDVNITFVVFCKAIALLQVRAVFKIFIQVIHFYHASIVSIYRIITSEPHKTTTIFKPKIIRALRETIVRRQPGNGKISKRIGQLGIAEIVIFDNSTT